LALPIGDERLRLDEEAYRIASGLRNPESSAAKLLNHR
jgi:hypothetical protein